MEKTKTFSIICTTSFIIFTVLSITINIVFAAPPLIAAARDVRMAYSDAPLMPEAITAAYRNGEALPSVTPYAKANAEGFTQ